MKTRKIALAITVMLMCMALSIGSVFAEVWGPSVGTATVESEAPTITNVELWDATEVTDKNNTALDPNNVEYHLNATISSYNPLYFLKNVTFIAWDNKGQLVTDADSQRYHYTWTWTESDDTWTSLVGESYIDQDDCEDPGTGEDTLKSYEFRLAYKLSKVANYSNAGDYSGWQFNITVFDDDENKATFGLGEGGRIQFGVASYQAITILDAAHTWAASPDTTNTPVTAGGDAKVDFTILSNRVWTAQAEGNQSALKGQGLIEGETITLDDHLTFYGTDSVLDSIVLPYDTEEGGTGYANIPTIVSLAAPTDEAAPTQKGCYLWLDVPAEQAAGQYSYELRIKVVTG